MQEKPTIYEGMLAEAVPMKEAEQDKLFMESQD